MKIAYTYDQLLKCGGTRVAFEHCRELNRRGHQAFIYANFVDPSLGDWIDRYQVRPLMLNTLEETNVLISCWWMQLEELLRVKASRRFHFVQGRDKLSYAPGHAWRDENDKAMHRTDYEYLAVSEWAGESCRLPKIVPNGVDTTFWHPASFPQLFDRFVVLLEASTSDVYKGLSESLEAVNAVRQNNPEKKIECWLVTKDNLSFSQVDRLIQNGNDVQILSAYQNASVLVKATHFDGFGLPHLEAMACGLPLVTTDAGGNMSFCHHDQNCLVADNIAHIVQHIQSLIESKPLRQRLAQGGMMTAKQWTWKNTVDKLLAAVE